ncbi:hypothetical protein Bxe_C0872 [Paraburkholderia xenovorans LB400]|uniref:Uncharacterized protein n=1 Tax=Paraburkholderia xenovorans (strain LB400) TaxID=266265 RepID=Q13GP0_PARXL|nr:hypothetical protein Bxe_C0872 [Paraburkholderia xenovorans LB400]
MNRCATDRASANTSLSLRALLIMLRGGPASSVGVPWPRPFAAAGSSGSGPAACRNACALDAEQVVALHPVASNWKRWLSFPPTAVAS